MPNPPVLERIAAHSRETMLLKSISGLIDWDEQVNLPESAAPYRAEQAAYIARLVHERETEHELGEWLAELAEHPDAADPASDAGCILRQLGRDYRRKTKLPAELVEQIAKTASRAQHAWVAARKNDDFASFRPLLEQMLDLRRQEAEAVGYEGSPYDALLDEYEPGETAESVAGVLRGLREELAPLVAEINQSDRKAPSELLRRDYPVSQQVEFGRLAAAAIGFDFDAGRLDVTAHPFCGEAGPLDVRMTTRYQLNDFSDGFFSILHETGHGLYEQGLPQEHYGLPMGQSISLGIHESQSRMWENLVGRSRGFWRRFFGPLQEAFPEATSGVDPDSWYFAVNESKPSLIRTESDEATYNLHIVVRFELERALVEGDLRVADLPAAWNDAYREVLGVTPPSNSDGVLQDVHWSAGLFGYFPTYALGNLYSAQFFDKAEQDLGDLEEQFAAGEYGSLLSWLRRHIHTVGERKTASELVESVTGQPLSHEPLMRRLRSKFGLLYGLV